MTVKELKKAIAKLPGDLLVVSSGGDHEYFPISLSGKTKAEKNGHDYYEYYTDEHMSEGGKVIDVVVID